MQHNNIMFVYVLTAYIVLVVVLQIKKHRQPGSKLAKKVGFFHPFCNDGGGGEKVLWSMIEALLENVPSSSTTQQYKHEPIINIYSLQYNDHQVLTTASNRFNIKLFDYAHRITFIKVKGRKLLQPTPKLTMICHIFLPMVYCFKCIWKYQPDIFYDTTGFAFNFLLVKLLLPFTQCRAYVHYPFISEEMIAKIRERRADYNNDTSISKSIWKTKAKLFYYYVVEFIYKLVRISVNSAQANSTWTQNHMKKIWGPHITRLYPPCSITDMLTFKKNYDAKQYKIISLAQFRPEKNHILQINVINNIVKKLTQKNGEEPNIHLYICGTTRNPEDQKLLESLKGKVQLLKLQKYISFCVNMKFPELLAKLKQSNYGIHTMQAQHFGISVVEMLAAGCLIVAHNSAGPKFDIIKDQRFLAESETQYEDKLLKILEMPSDKKYQCSQELRRRMNEFGEKSFKQNFRNIFYGRVRQNKKQQ